MRKEMKENRGNTYPVFVSESARMLMDSHPIYGIVSGHAASALVTTAQFLNITLRAVEIICPPQDPLEPPFDQIEVAGITSDQELRTIEMLNSVHLLFQSKLSGEKRVAAQAVDIRVYPQSYSLFLNENS